MKFFLPSSFCRTTILIHRHEFHSSGFSFLSSSNTTVYSFIREIKPAFLFIERETYKEMERMEREERVRVVVIQAKDIRIYTHTIDTHCSLFHAPFRSSPPLSQSQIEKKRGEAATPPLLFEKKRRKAILSHHPQQGMVDRSMTSHLARSHWSLSPLNRQRTVIWGCSGYFRFGSSL